MIHKLDLQSYKQLIEPGINLSKILELSCYLCIALDFMIFLLCTKSKSRTSEIEIFIENCGELCYLLPNSFDYAEEEVNCSVNKNIIPEKNQEGNSNFSNISNVSYKPLAKTDLDKVKK